MPVSRRIPLLAALALAFPVLLFFVHAHTATYQGDTDRYYHFALSRMLMESHAFHLETLPQAEDLGWKDYFPDKEFLFHVLTKLGYEFAGERGAENAALAVASGVGIVLFWFALGVLGPLEAFTCAFAAFATHFFMIRLTFLRPHVLAILLLVLLNAAIARRKSTLAGVTAVIYGLAYHAFYFPLAAAALTLGFAQLEEENARRQLRILASAVFAGTIVGLVINPYFPSNVMLGIMHALVPFRTGGGLKGASFGFEALPLAGPGLLKFFYFPYLVVLAAVATRVYRDFAGRFLLVMTLAFVAASFLTTRAGEPLVPMAGLLLPLVVVTVRERRWIYPLALSQLAVLVYLCSHEAGFNPDEELHGSVRSAISAIPAGPGKVLNCEWSMAPFLLYQRPDLRFVDLLDPSFLFEANPKYYYARLALMEGKISDPRAMVNLVFGAEYVLCQAPGLIGQLDADPAFERLYPPHGEPVRTALFRARAKPVQQFVRKFRVRILPANETSNVRDYVPGNEALSEVTVPENTVVISLSDQKAPGMSCARFSLAKDEVARLAGADYLGVGGGGAVRAWRNGKLLYGSGPEFSHARSVQALIPLRPPLKAAEAVDLLVCSGPATQYWAGTVSLWTAEAARETCHRKAESAGGYSRPPLAAFTSNQETCLGPLAGPAVPAELRP
jgi:hypothetical protein